ncbi:glucose PTS transporter subunit IIA, partial [Sphingomonas sp. CROZ-RG-20F-R02-07]|uniref:glucose PTS transporter subunit IIA n=1 Tax=Sphingomonas sp. CROZ-RG-20F-R02-07 TaxID=2914832 RepID=UPI001F5AE960
MTTITLFAPLAGWAMPIAEVPDPVFAEGMLGEGMAIDPTGDTLHAPCDGTILTVHAARHAVTMAMADGTELLMHIGIDSVALCGAGFTALVRPGDAVRAGDPLIRFDLDRLVTGASAAVTPLLLTGAGVAIGWRHPGGIVAVGEALFRFERQAAAPGTAVASGAERVRTMRIGLPHGLHARPAARIVAALRPLAAEVTLASAGRQASAASSIALLGLGLAHDTPVTITARGDDAEVAIDAVAALLTREVGPAVPPPARARAAAPSA